MGINQDGVNKDLAELKAAETKRKTVFEAMEFLGFAVRCQLWWVEMCEAPEVSWILWSV